VNSQNQRSPAINQPLPETPKHPSWHHFSAVIVGGGQVGLAAAKALLDEGLRREDLLVLEAGAAVGSPGTTAGTR
jgi:cation diffusion facilitator CzcD-associated flavoprotein CzcO